MEITEIGEPQSCGECIFQEIIDSSSSSSCRFYPRYKNIPYPMHRSSIMKPAFCRIKKIVVYEEPWNKTWGVPDGKD
jgi:hypothetical protein